MKIRFFLCQLVLLAGFLNGSGIRAETPAPTPTVTPTPQPSAAGGENTREEILKKLEELLAEENKDQKKIDELTKELDDLKKAQQAGKSALDRLRAEQRQNNNQNKKEKEEQQAQQGQQALADDQVAAGGPPPGVPGASPPASKPQNVDASFAQIGLADATKKLGDTTKAQTYDMPKDVSGDAAKVLKGAKAVYAAGASAGAIPVAPLTGGQATIQVRSGGAPVPPAQTRLVAGVRPPKGGGTPRAQRGPRRLATRGPSTRVTAGLAAGSRKSHRFALPARSAKGRSVKGRSVRAPASTEELDVSDESQDSRHGQGISVEE